MNVKMNQDWVKNVLVKYNFFFLKNIKSDNKVLDLLHQSLNEDISIEFDDRRLYLFKNNRDIFIEIDVRTPCEILELLLFLITEKQMSENIRNAENRIWFRSYKGNSFLDCQKNEIRNELFWSASILCSAARTLTYFFRRKGSAILVDDDYEKYLDEARYNYRLKSGLKYVLDNLRNDYSHMSHERGVSERFFL